MSDMYVKKKKLMQKKKTFCGNTESNWLGSKISAFLEKFYLLWERCAGIQYTVKLLVDFYFWFLP